MPSNHLIKDLGLCRKYGRVRNALLEIPSRNMECLRKGEHLSLPPSNEHRRTSNAVSRGKGGRTFMMVHREPGALLFSIPTS